MDGWGAVNAAVAHALAFPRVSPFLLAEPTPGLEATSDAIQRKLAAICDNSRHKRGRAASLTMLIHPCQLLARLALESLWRVSAK